VKLNQKNLINISKVTLSVFSLLTLSACQSGWDIGADFGSTVNDAIKLQTIHADAPKTSIPPKEGLDGVAAKVAVDNYQKSLEVKSNSNLYPGGGVLSPSNSGSSGASIR
jgi:hypothetical protein